MQVQRVWSPARSHAQVGQSWRLTVVRSRNCQEEGFLFAWDGGKEVKVSSQSHVKWSLLCPREPQLTAHLSILKIVIDTGKKKERTVVEGNQVVSNIAKPSLPPPGHCSVVRCGLLPSLKSPGRGPHPAPPCSEADPPAVLRVAARLVSLSKAVLLCANHPDSQF